MPIKPIVLALDLERTLIDNAMSSLPRPGLREFMDFCQHHFQRVAIYTTVEEAEAREVFHDLHKLGLVSSDLFQRLEFINWMGEYKDLTCVKNAAVNEILLVDDDESWIRPDQKAQWISIKAWDGGHDDELSRVQQFLKQLQ